MQLKQLQIFIILFFGTLGSLSAQEVWTLDKCIEYSWQNSLQVKQTAISTKQAELSHKQAKWAIWPSANASIRHGVNLGRSIDLTTYNFVNQTTQSTNLSLNINAPLYQGMQLRNSIKQTKVDIQAAEKDAEQAKNNLALSVAQAYLSILLAEENVEVLKEQIKVSQSQYDRTLKLIEAGALPENNKYDLEAQLALDEENIVNAENAVVLAYLSLKVAMNMDVGDELKIEHTEIEIPENVELMTLDDMYTEARTAQPNVIAARMRVQSAEYSVKVAQGALQPSISAYGSFATNYSSAGRRVVGTDTVTQVLSGDLGGVPFSADIDTEIPLYDKYPYFPQLADNISAGFGVSISIPIFNNMRTRIAIQQAKLGVELARLSIQSVEVQLKSDIERSLTDAKAAAKRLAAAEKSVKATRASVENTRKRFDLGIVNAFELTSVQNRLMAAESNVLQARYDYLFKLKILDYYRGLEIRIN